MNKLLTLLIALIWAAFTSCSSNDEPSIEKDSLAQTTWAGTDVCYENDEEIASTPFIVNFLTDTKAQYIFVDENGNPYGDGELKYAIKGEIIYFSGAIVGEWTIVEYNKNRMVLRSFQPKLHIMTLERI